MALFSCVHKIEQKAHFFLVQLWWWDSFHLFSSLNGKHYVCPKMPAPHQMLGIEQSKTEPLFSSHFYCNLDNYDMILLCLSTNFLHLLPTVILILPIFFKWGCLTLPTSEILPTFKVWPSFPLLLQFSFGHIHFFFSRTKTIALVSLPFLMAPNRAGHPVEAWCL